MWIIWRRADISSQLFVEWQLFEKENLADYGERLWMKRWPLLLHLLPAGMVWHDPCLLISLVWYPSILIEIPRVLLELFRYEPRIRWFTPWIRPFGHLSVWSGVPLDIIYRPSARGVDSRRAQLRFFCAFCVEITQRLDAFYCPVKPCSFFLNRRWSSGE